MPDLFSGTRPKREPLTPFQRVRRVVRRHARETWGKDCPVQKVADDLRMDAATVVSIWKDYYWGIVLGDESDPASCVLGEEGE